VQGISDIITIPGVINRDFADVKTTMAGMGYAVMGTAQRSGPDRAKEAAMAAMASPLLEAGAIDGARGILINITGSSSLKLNEVNAASTIIQNAAHEDANIIFGAVLDEKMGDEVKITVIATGFRQDQPKRREKMLADTPAEIPVKPREERPKFASEAAAARSESPELVPVPASVFDDEFFRSSRVVESVAEEVRVVETPVEVAPEPVVTGGYPYGSDAQPSSYVGQASLAPAEESDELDIPAFLRRGNN
jgi:cell division protein FtsZ